MWFLFDVVDLFFTFFLSLYWRIAAWEVPRLIQCSLLGWVKTALFLPSVHVRLSAGLPFWSVAMYAWV
jgi:hypothetical protein